MTSYYTPPRYTLKQGDTLDLSAFSQKDDGDPAIMTGWTGSAQVRELDGTLVEQLTFAWLDASQGLFSVYSVDDTSAWPVGRLKCDVQFITPAGKIISTPTVILTIVEDVTT